MTDRISELGFASVEEYQQFHGLRVDGVVGPVTARHLDMPRFCQLPDHAPQRAELRKFPSLEVTYANAHPAPGFTLESTMFVTDLAIRAWNRTSKLKAVRAASTQQATILLTVGRIDGKNGTLAWSELAKLPQTLQRYDQHEPWKVGEDSGGKWNAVPYPYIDLYVVMVHELGHAFGLDHAPGTGNILSPIYSPQNTAIGQWETDQMVSRYGVHEGDPDEPTPDPAKELVIAFSNARVVR